VSNSESLFEDYLKQHNFSYQKDFIVTPGNIDFKVGKNDYIVLCDVKEVRDRKKGKYGQISPQDQIRSDIRKIRRKFGRQRPSLPVILITMNFGTNFFTGLSVQTALMGDIGVYIDATTKTRSELLHLSRGNAAFTKYHNTTISAVLAFDVKNQIYHCLFRNPFTHNPIPQDYFPVWKAIDLNPNANEENLKILSSLMFWPKSFNNTY
jgi:hypothetical protein